MAVTVKKNHFGGGAALANGGKDDLASIIRSLIDDNTNLRNALNAVVTKLNADAGVTDTNYAQAPALNTVKG